MTLIKTLIYGDFQTNNSQRNNSERIPFYKGVGDGSIFIGEWGYSQVG